MNSLSRAVVLLIVLASGTAPAAEPKRIEIDLDRCIRMALEGNLRLKAAAVAPGIGRTLVQEASAEFDQLLAFRSSVGEQETPTANPFEGSDVLETDSFDFDVSTTRKLVTGARIGLGYRTDRLGSDSFFATLDPAWRSAFYLELTQPLLRGGWTDYNRSRIDLARRERDAARDDLDAAVQDLIVAVEAAYWDLVFAKTEVEVKQASLEVAEESLETTRRRIEAEKATRVEETQALTGLENRRLELIGANNRFGNAQDRLRALLLPFHEGDPEPVVIIPTDEPVVTKEAILTEPEAVELALDRQPSLRAARLGVEAREIEVQRARNEVLPRLDLFGTAQLGSLDDNYGGTWDPLLGADNLGWSVGISFEFPFGNHAARSRLQRARLEERRQTALLDDLTSEIIVAVRTSIRDLQAARQSIEAAERARQFATEQLANEQARLRAGVSTPFQVLQVEEDLTNARSTEIGARTAYRVALAGYLRALGILGDRYGIDPKALEIR
jgi:outer membrane protein TolC